ncbi:MAG: FAD-dependent oxidoreductase, partial [Alphaproteobacteria bacterium]|nr:FAD-dependent oxidoreductase [Alphaproteobacteria bacterium]
AGNCPNFSGSWGIMKLQRYSTRLYARLAEETGYPINYHVTGAVRLAQDRERMAEFRHVTAMARHQGIAFEMLSAQEIRQRHPFVELHGLEGGQWDPLDGDIDPAQLTQAFARGARDAGATIIRGCRVTAMSARADGAWRISTTQGEIVAEIVVNAAGYRAAEIGSMVGRDVPCTAMAHQYLVTADIPELGQRVDKLPLLRDPLDSYYLRQEGSGLLLGPYEWRPRAHWDDGVPAEFAFQLFPDDVERLERHIDLAVRRVPILGSVGLKKVINGPIPYTPDGNPLIGPAPGLRNFFEACVFSFGIVQAGGAGKTLADWVIEGEPEWDLWSLDPRRFTAHVTPAYTRAKAIELYQNEYAIGFPFEERPAGRPAKSSPLYGALQARGALFGARNGWERAIWFPRDGAEASLQDRLTLRRPDFTPAIARECHAVAERVGLIELPGFSRYRVSGPEAAARLNGAIAGRLPPVGRVSLAYVLGERGGVVAEFTITRLAEDSFWLLSASSAEWHDRDVLAQHVAGPGVRIAEETADFTTLVITGPRSRELLSRVTGAELGAWLQWCPVRIAGRELVALRISYVGELGWELHVAMADAAAVHAALRDAGEALGLADIGIYAVDSLRLEKCYRAWKQELTTEYSILAAGLERFVRLDKPDFPGRAALLRERDAGGPADRLVALLVDAGDADAPINASVLHLDEPVGIVTSGGYGHRIRRSIALAYVRSSLATPGTALAIDILGDRRRAIIAAEPLYDPANSRLRS